MKKIHSTGRDYSESIPFNFYVWNLLQNNGMVGSGEVGGVHTKQSWREDELLELGAVCREVLTLVNHLFL